MSKALDDLTAILEERGAEYGTGQDDKANLREAVRLGVHPIVGVLVRAGDKWGRICSIITNSATTGQPVHDAVLREQMLDLAGYMIKGMELLDESNSVGDQIAPDGGATDLVSSGRRWFRSVLSGIERPSA